jgi:hypothetical protein
MLQHLLKLICLAASLWSAVAFIFTHNQLKKIVDEAVDEALKKDRASTFKWKPWIPVLLPTSAATAFIVWVRRCA